MKKLYLFCLLMFYCIISFAQPASSNLIQPFRVQNNYLRIQSYPNGSITDSLLVILSSNNRWIGKTSINDYGFIKGTYTGFDNRYKSIDYVPSWSEILSKPDFSIYYLNSNPSNFISNEIDPTWSSEKAYYRTKLQNDDLYQTKGSYISTELDPTVSSYIKGINSSYFANGNIAYSWGNHALEGYLKSINSSMVITALGFNPVPNTRTVNYKALSSDIIIDKNDVGLGNVANKRLETYTRTTDVNGNITVTFATSFSVAPVILPTIPNQSNKNEVPIVTAVSTTGFTVNVFARSAVTLLTIEVLLAATTNIPNRVVDILVQEKT